MLSLKRCREILGPDCDLAESDLRKLRDELYRLTEILSGHFQRKMETREEETTTTGGRQR